MTKNPDDWFDRYKFCQPLGQGGMGIIYLAEDKQNGQAPCVVKQLISTSTDSEERDEAIRLFMREVHMLSHLDHRGIVRFFDHHVTKDGKYFLVMDFIPGKNLEAIVSQYGPFTSEATVEIGIQCCEVLEYLHELDPPIIYRDLKPSNLMLTPEGEIVFIDFGIARTFMPKQSATRVVTAGYSPPEQYFGRPETRSDLYALGATLGHLLTGQRPKPLSSSAPRMLKHDVLFTLDDLVRRMTAHNPEDRPTTSRQVRYELYHIYQEIHPDFEVPQEALLALEKLSIANKYLASPAWKAQATEAQQRLSQQSGPEVDEKKVYDARDLQRLTMDKNQTLQRRLKTKKEGIWEHIKRLLNIR